MTACGQCTGSQWPGTERSQLTGIPLTPEQVWCRGILKVPMCRLPTEMVNLIVAQRAYEMNSKAITTTDEMMQTANNLKR